MISKVFFCTSVGWTMREDEEQGVHSMVKSNGAWAMREKMIKKTNQMVVMNLRMYVRYLDEQW